MRPLAKYHSPVDVHPRSRLRFRRASLLLLPRARVQGRPSVQARNIFYRAAKFTNLTPLLIEALNRRVGILSVAEFDGD